jgi:hypothetical protein
MHRETVSCLRERCAGSPVALLQRGNLSRSAKIKVFHDTRIRIDPRFSALAKYFDVF